MKVAARRDKTHNPSGETCWVSRLRENFTSGSYGEGLETGRTLISVPRQSFTRQIYFRILKSGCKIEKLQLEHVERLRPALALYMIVAWRVLYLTLMGRECPELPCDLVFETSEWQAVYLVATKTRPSINMDRITANP